MGLLPHPKLWDILLTLAILCGGFMLQLNERRRQAVDVKPPSLQSMQNLGAVELTIVAKMIAHVQEFPGNLQPLAGLQVTSV